MSPPSPFIKPYIDITKIIMVITLTFFLRYCHDLQGQNTYHLFLLPHDSCTCGFHAYSRDLVYPFSPGFRSPSKHWDTPAVLCGHGDSLVPPPARKTPILTISQC